MAAGLAVGFAGKNVADLGAGEGTLTLLLARYGAHVTAVDQSTRMLALLEEKAGEAGVQDQVRIAEGDIESLPLESASFDAVFLSQVLHHAAKPHLLAVVVVCEVDSDLGIFLLSSGVTYSLLTALSQICFSAFR